MNFRQPKKPRSQKCTRYQIYFRLCHVRLRNKYLSNNDKIYSTVVQETQAELALTEVAETTLQQTSTMSSTKQRKRSGPLQKIRLYLFENMLFKTENQKNRFILLFYYPRKLCRSTKRNQSHLWWRNGKGLQRFQSLQSLFWQLCNWCSFLKGKKPGALNSRRKCE